MITLDDTTTKLQLTTSGAAAVDVSVQFVDETHEGKSAVAASQETAIASATTTDILAVPATSNRRVVQQITLSNKGANSNTVTLLKDVNGTDYRIGGAVSLGAGEWLTVDREGRFTVYLSDGRIKTQTNNGGGNWARVVKLATESITSDSTLSNDAELIVALSAATKYSIRVVLFISSANATMDYKFATDYSGTVTGTPQSYYRALFAGATPGTDVEAVGHVAGLITSTAVAVATGGTAHLVVEQVIETNTAGTWGIQWAQNTSDAGALAVYFGSYLEYMVVA